GIDKGSAAASLVPFTAYGINGTPQRLVNGIIPPIQHAIRHVIPSPFSDSVKARMLPKMLNTSIKTHLLNMSS
ncbi:MULTISPECIES: hypothetical protein, partial [unclassified Kosakonia]|uniref:hypothetical protein n=1 Tax=unclassified Kosakonia TaxID=2632876 RepID=UPI001F25CC9B